MKQMSLIEMDGFLKGKCIPRDLKVNETNAEYLVRKFGELESKLETALRECRSAGITIDNLEARCAALLDELDKWRQESSAWQVVAEKQLALAASAEQKIAELESLTAPKLPHPAPVSVPEVVGWEDVPEEITEDDIALASAWAHGFNQCRAAMLQGSQPVSQTYKFPVNTPCQDAPAHIWLQTAGVWPEDGELSELTWCSHNQHHDDTLYVRADLVNGNSPVTPDGWISCSERMPEKYDFDIWVFSPSRGVLDGLQWDGSMFTDDEYQFVIHDATHWMRKAYPAAPQQDGE